MAHVLVTGASSGFGYEMSRRLSARGHRVLATMRDTAGRNAEACRALESTTADGAPPIEVLEMDVTDDASVAEAVQSALDRAGHLDVVVNNAGISCLGLTEAFTPETFTRVFDINVNGPVRVNRAVLPAMRARGAGLLVHVSSGAGRVTVPALAPYCASKFALEALADAYRYELHPWGVQSILIEPGTYRTPIFERALTPTDTARLASYGPHGAYVDDVANVFAAAIGDPENAGAADVADALVRLVEMEPAARPFRTVVSAPLAQLLAPYNDMAESLRPIVASIFNVTRLVGPDGPPTA